MTQMQCITGADPGIFDWVGRGGGWGSNFVSEKTVELFCGKLLLPHNPDTPTPPHPLLPNAVANKFPWPVKK